jgi:hypothetical protein
MTDHDVAVGTPPDDTSEQGPERSLAEQLVDQAHADGKNLVGPSRRNHRFVTITTYRSVRSWHGVLSVHVRVRSGSARQRESDWTDGFGIERRSSNRSAMPSLGNREHAP